MTSEKIELDISEKDQSLIINLFIKTCTSEPTQDHIQDLFGKITPENMKEVAFAAAFNEAVIKVIEAEVKHYEQQINGDTDDRTQTT